MYDLLEQQFTNDLRPRLYRLAYLITGPLPLPVRFLSWILVAMLIFGIIIPFFVMVSILPQYFTALAAAAMLAFLLYIALSFRRTLSIEAEIIKAEWRNPVD